VAVAAEIAAPLGWPIDLGAPNAGPFGFAWEATLPSVEDAGMTDAHVELHRVRRHAGGAGTKPEVIARDFVVRTLRQS
jgi:hypothetical protein